MNFQERIKKDIPLKDYTTYKIGGPAKYFFVAESKDDVLEALAYAKKEQLNILVLGGGSNLLVSNKGFDGLVIKIETKGMEVLEHDMVEAGAGVTMEALVNFTIENSLGGIEWAGGLPGTFGGAIRGNAGAFGGEIKDTIFEVTSINDKHELVVIPHAECHFSYRNSLFKENGWPVVSAKLQLKKGDKAALRAVADSRIAYRKDKHPLEYPNAGSIFKGVAFEDIPADKKELFADKVKNDPFPVVPAAWFIIEAGLTGKQIGQAQFSKKHSNYIVNLGGATAEDIRDLIEVAKTAVKEKFGIELEPEIQLIEK